MTDANQDKAKMRKLREAIAAAGFTQAGLLEPTAETRAHLAEALAAAGGAETAATLDPVSAAMAVLENDPELTPALSGKVTRKQPKDFSTLPEVLTMSAATMIVLSSYVELERDKQGRWQFKFIVKPQTEKMKEAIFALIRSTIGALPPR